MSGKTKADEAVALALKWAADDSHGYDQASRWGPDYDCSSFLIAVWDAVGVHVKAAGATYTGNMRQAFLRCGFVEVPLSGGLRAGDVLLNETRHTAMYVGDGRVVQASQNEAGTVTGGKTGDQTGREICVMPYYTPSYGWDCVLRYEGGGGVSVPDEPKPALQGPTAPLTGFYRPGDRYMVQPGDSLWGIAERLLGDGTRWHDLYEYNNLASTEIHVGDVIELPPEGWHPQASDPKPQPSASETDELPELRRGDSGYAVESLQLLLLNAGYPIGESGIDGDLGPDTEAALRAFQDDRGLTVTGSTTPVTWVLLIRG